MKANQTDSYKANKRLTGILLVATFLLLIPLVLQLWVGSGVDGQGINWRVGDFVITGILLFGSGLLCEFAMRKVQTTRNRILICGAVLFIFFLIWVELAAGIFGTPFAGT